MCLDLNSTDYNGSAYPNYDMLNEFSKNLSDREKFCCDFLNHSCNIRGNAPCSPNLASGQCADFQKLKFCVTSGYSATKNPGGLCGGTLSDRNSSTPDPEPNNIT